MKFSSTLLLQAAATASAAVVGRQAMSMPAPGETVIGRSGGVAPEIENVKSPFSNIPGIKRVKMRYGPYTLPSTKTKNFESQLLGVSGMIDVITHIKKPCTSGCTVVSVLGDLEYTNGTRALTSDGSWLHHSVLFTNGPGRRDAGCGIPGMDPWFSTGDERNPAYYADVNSTIDTGYHINDGDNFFLYSELMNMDPVAKEVYMVLYYDIVPTTPAMTKQTVSVWLELNQCGMPDTSRGNLNLLQQPQKNVFSELTHPWYSPYNGNMVYVSGHEHDGGTNLVIYKNDAVLCDTKANYNAPMESSMGAMPGMGGSTTAQPTSSIGAMTYCRNMGAVKKGDQFHISANYNLDKYPGMKKDDGSLDEVMGISILMISVPKEEAAAPINFMEVTGLNKGLGGLGQLPMKVPQTLQELIATGGRFGIRKNAATAIVPMAM
ncbi:hypothetical protein K402DRAFT_467905 [Aulographum hederae CBS 113979]|uniref:Uncharacterized protein n=1 Tax=Aulographum hederae CBS 113979 TaxID=1176131 RepID=A0A6G1GJP7_9PEZI|nr:hypothetical protein K402DRAFT_467905 [Aulographum hederae CBS 113979]